MNNEYVIKEDLSGCFQKNIESIEKGIYCSTGSLVREPGRMIETYALAGMSGLTLIVSFVCLLFGMVNGFWPGAGTAFSFYTLITSLSGIFFLICYFVCLNIFYFQLVKINKKFKLL